MGYRIVYGKKDLGKKLSGSRLRLMTAGCLLGFALLVRTAWPQGAGVLRMYLLPGEPTAGEAAFSTMLEELRQGEPLEDALEAFCRQILEDAQAY